MFFAIAVLLDSVAAQRLAATPMATATPARSAHPALRNGNHHNLAEVPALPPNAPVRRQLGLVTLWDGEPHQECGLPLWCQQALDLKSKIPPPWRTSLVVMAPKTSGECKSASYVWRNDTADANDVYLRRQIKKQATPLQPERQPIGGSWAYLKNCLLLKWSVFAMTQLDLILYSDIDVDLSPAHSHFMHKVWLQSVDAFLRSPAQIVTTYDRFSPINLGVFLAKPAPWVHRLALRFMRETSWSADTGFGGAGSPRNLFRKRGRLFSQLEAGLGINGTTPISGSAPMHLARTAMMQQNTWNFMAGNLDQGMFWHLLYHTYGVGTWAQTMSPWRVDHFWGPGKPWLPHGNAMNVYLRRLRLPGKLETRCEQHLAYHIAALRKENKWQVSDSPGWTPHLQVVVPDFRLADRFKPISAPLDAAEAGSRETDLWLTDATIAHLAALTRRRSNQISTAVKARMEFAQEWANLNNKPGGSATTSQPQLLSEGPLKPRRLAEGNHTLGNRTFHVYLPPITPAPVMLLIHGNGDTGGMVLEYEVSGDAAFVATHILVAPDGLKKSWNIKGGASAGFSTADDAGFVGKTLLEHVASFDNVVPEFTMMGYSQGGTLVNRVLIENDDPRITAAITDSAQFMTLQYHNSSFWAGGADDSYSTPKVVKPRRLLMIFGGRDDVNPAHGGKTKISSGDGSNLISVNWEDATLAYARACGYTGAKGVPSPHDDGTKSGFFTNVSYLDGQVKAAYFKGFGHCVSSEPLIFNQLKAMLDDFIETCALPTPKTHGTATDAGAHDPRLPSTPGCLRPERHNGAVHSPWPARHAGRTAYFDAPAEMRISAANAAAKHAKYPPNASRRNISQ